MSWSECLSMLELQEIKQSGEGEAATHLQECARCRALLRELPTVGEAPSLVLQTPKHMAASRPDVASPVRPAAGQVWRAASSPESPWSQIVAVVGRSRVEPGLLIVVPVSEETALGTDLDVRLPSDVLGYDAMLLAWNHGALLEDQLVEPVGLLSDAARDDLVSFYRWLVVGGERPDVPVVGQPLAGPDDERAWFRSEELERFFALRKKASEEPEGEEIVSDEDPEPEESFGEAPGTVISFGDFLKRKLASEEWDANSLMESTGVSREELDGFLADSLQLTTAADARALALVVRELGADPQELEPQIRLSLTRSPGGVVASESGWRRVAARTRSHISSQQRDKDLFADRKIDESEVARSHAVDLYWERLLELYETLSQ